MSEVIGSAVIEVGVDSRGVDAGFAKIDGAVVKTGRTLESLGGSANKGFNDIDVGARKAAGAVDKSTKNLADSIQRATAAMSAGTKGSAEYYAALASSRGANVAALKPYLDQLDAMAKKTAIAADAQKRLDESSRFLDGLKGRTDAIGKTASQLAEMQAAQLGVSASAAPMIARMREAEEASGGLGESLGNASSKIRAFAIGMAGVVSVGAFVSGVKSAIDALADLDDMAQKTGSSVENLSRLQKVAQMVEQDFGQVDAALVKLAKGMGGLDEDSNKVMSALKRLGVSSKDAAGKLRDPAEVAIEAANNLQKYADGAGKTALANDMLGKSGADLLPYLNDVAESIDKFTGDSKEAAAAATKYKDSMGLLRVEYDNIAKSIARDALPAMVDFIGALDDTRKATAGLTSTSAAEWADDFAVGLARVVDVAVLIPAIIKNIAGSFKSVYADITVLGSAAKNLNPYGMIVNRLQGKSPLAEFQKDVDARNKIVEDANKELADLWVSPANKMEQSVLGRIAGRNTGSENSIDAMGSLLGGGANSTKPALDYTGISDKNAAAIEKEADAYASLASSINERIAASAREAAGLAPLTESQKLQVSLDAQIASGKLALTSAHKAAYEQQIKSFGITEAVIAAQKQLAVSAAESAKSAAEYAGAIGKSVGDAVNEAKANEWLAETFGMSKRAIEELNIARMEERLERLRGIDMADDEVAALEAIIDAKKRNAAAVGSIDAQTVAKKASDDMLADWKKSVEQYDDVFRKGFAGMVNGGKGAWKAFTTSLVTTFKTSVADQIYKMFAQPFVVKMVASLMGVTGGGMAGAAQAAGSVAGDGGGAMGALSMASGIKSAYTAITTGFSGLSASVTGYTQAAMNSVNGTNYAMAASQNGGFATGAGTAAGYAAGAAVGIYGGRMISGGYSAIGGGSGNTAVNVGTAIGAFFGPLGAAVGGLIGGLVNRAFGMKRKEVTSQGIEGDFSGSGFAGNEFSTWHQDGGWLRSDKDGRNTNALDATTSNQLGVGFASLQMASAGAAAALGLSADAIANYSERISITLTGDRAGDTDALTVLFSGIGDRMASAAAPGIASLAKAGETAGATLNRLAFSITTTNTWLSLLKRTLFDVSLAGGDAASKLADAFGGMDKLAASSGAFYQAYYTEAERVTRSQQDMTDALSLFGMAMPATKNELRAMAGALDLNTDAGRTAYATLLALAPEFSNISNAIQKMAQESADKLMAEFGGDSIDFGGLGEAMQAANAETFVATIALVFDNLAGRIKGVIDGIAGERDSVREAALQIANPAVMTRDAIERGIAGINIGLPSNGGAVAANAALSAAASAQAAAIDSANAISRESQKLASGRQNAILGTLNTAEAPRTNAPGKSSDAAWESIIGKAWSTHVAKFGVGWNGIRTSGAARAANMDRMIGQYDAQRAAGNAPILASASAISSVDQAAIAATAAVNAGIVSAKTAAKTAAEIAAKNATLAYAAALQGFAIDAGKSVGKLAKLREETVKYYDAQKQLADLMAGSAAGLRKTSADYRVSQLAPEDQFKELIKQFTGAYSMALSTDGATLAGYGDKLGAMINPLLTLARDTMGSDAAYASFAANALAKTDSIAAKLEALTPTDYAADSLAMLGQIDATLAALDASSRSAEQIIASAINAGSDRTAAGLHAVIEALAGKAPPAFAAGGFHAGGLRIVGENGPELESTGPSRIFNAAQTRGMFAGSGNAEMVAEIRALRDELTNLLADNKEMAQDMKKLKDTMVNVTRGGESMLTEAA
jgi:hypothetical protein